MCTNSSKNIVVKGTNVALTTGFGQQINLNEEILGFFFGLFVSFYNKPVLYLVTVGKLSLSLPVTE